MKTSIAIGAFEISELEFNQRAEKVRSLLKTGDLISHRRCMGSLEEHIFVEFSGVWICGKATATTKKFGGEHATDIHPGNVTHINRTYVDSIL